MKKTIGILAHVDAGKTTCIESMLYRTNVIKQLGRVDNKNAQLDYDLLERQHGITIYTKETYFSWKDTEIYVIDTPGHVDFSSAMESALKALDVAVVLISGPEGIQGHTETIWKCLKQYSIPTIVFVNKMDISYRTKEEIWNELQELSPHLYDFEKQDMEELCFVNDSFLEEYTKKQFISNHTKYEAMKQREYIPVVFGSALKGEGIDFLLDAIVEVEKEYDINKEFGAFVYRISHDKQGNRLTHIKMTSGRLCVKDSINEEKVDQIRLYQGETFTTLQEVEAGMICAIKGLSHSMVGQGFGIQETMHQSLLVPMIRYQLGYPSQTDGMKLVNVLQELAKEDREFQFEASEDHRMILVSLMGEMQKEVLQQQIEQRTGIHVTFEDERIVYRETINDTVFGYGHFEPLRHYAEVHVKLEPLPRNSGIQIENAIASNQLSQSFQKAILASFENFQMKGVLTRSQLTDVRITIVHGKGHLKHTEGGDFRQAAKRAVRQALMKADNVLLEPYVSFELSVPQEVLSNILYDLQNRNATTQINNNEELIRITGRGPFRNFMHYHREFTILAKGKGKVFIKQDGFDCCQEQDNIVEQIGYHPESDRYYSADSIFTKQGSGVIVPWYEVEDWLDIKQGTTGNTTQYHQQIQISDSDLDRLYELAFGKKKEKTLIEPKGKQVLPKEKGTEDLRKSCLIVDGYNVIYDWEELKEIANTSIALARDALIEKLIDYKALTGEEIILVFDGYKVKENYGETKKKEGITVVYTPSKVTADRYIERISLQWKQQFRITVASSDGLIQNAALAHGALRISARELHQQIEARKKIRLEEYHAKM